jgi:hypothetical protein
MLISLQAIESLLRAVHAVEYSLPGAPISLTVKYVGDDQEYFGHPPCRNEPFTASGLRDPALSNTGPISFSDIEWVTIESRPRHHAHSMEYEAKFEALVLRLSSVAGVLVTHDRITAPHIGEG